MLRNFIWKYFPPKPVSELDVELAKNEFENARNYVLSRRESAYYGSFSYNHLVYATRNYHRILGKKKRYEIYQREFA